MPKLKFESFFKNAFFIFFTRFFTALANLSVIILYSRSLPQALYGNYTNFWIQLNLIYPIACIGIQIIITTYPPEYLNALMKNLRKKHYFLFFIWLIAVAGVFATLQEHNLQSWLVPFLFFIVFSLSVFIESLLIVYKQFLSLSLLNLIFSCSFFCIHYFLLKNSLSLYLLFAVILVLSILRLFVYILLIFKYPKQNIPTQEIIPEEFKKVKTLWLHLGLYDVSQNLFSWIDKFIVALVLIPELSAIYYNGTLNIPFLPILLNAASTSILLELANHNVENEPTTVILLLHKSAKLLSCVVFPLFFYLLIFRQAIICGILTDKYLPAIPIFLISILVLPLRAYSFTTVLQKFHKGNIINMGGLADLVLGCALMYPLYLLWGLPGLALSFVISTYFQAGYYLFHSAKLLHVSFWRLLPLKNWLTKLLIIGCIFLLTKVILDKYFTFNDWVLIGIGVGMMILVILLSLFLDKVVEIKNLKNN